MKSRRLIALLLTFVMALGLIACGAKEESAVSETVETTETADAEEASSEEVPVLSVLTFADWYGEGMKALESYIHENAQELGFDVEIEMIAGGTEGEELIRAKFATGDLPDLLVNYGCKWLDYSWNVLDKMVPLENVDMSEYDEEMLKAGYYIHNDQLYNVPIQSAELYGVFYNKEVFEAAGITELPTNLEEFEACCETLKAYGVTPIYYSAADSWTLFGMSYFGINQDVVESGLSYTEFWNEMNTNQRHYADCENLKASIQLLKDFIDKGYVNETYLSDSYDMAQTAVAEGTAAMHFNATFFYDEIAEKYPDDPEVTDNIGSFVMPLLGNETVLSGSPRAIGMTVACEDRELGEKALNFIASSEAQQIYSDAQPGVYWNQAIECDLPEAYMPLYNEMLAGNSALQWQKGNVYSIGDYISHVQDFLAGGMEIDQIIELLDKDTADSAIVAGDPNWQ